MIILWAVLHVTEDRSPSKGKIPVPALEAWLRSRWTSSSSTTYVFGLARSEGVCTSYTEVCLMNLGCEVCVWAVSKSHMCVNYVTGAD